MEEMKSRLLETALEYCACGPEVRSSKGEDIIRGMKEYAQKNYHMDISVRMLAGKSFFYECGLSEPSLYRENRYQLFRIYPPFKGGKSERTSGEGRLLHHGYCVYGGV